MSKAKHAIAPQYIRAETRRQRYLDFFNENPGKTASDLGQHMIEMFDDASNTSNTTRQMLDLGELRAVKTNRIWKYFACATKTMQAIEFSIKQRTAAKRRMDEIHGNLVEQVSAKVEPWRYVHKPGQQIHRAGGQGAVRQKVYVAGCMG